jgi:hypothetical protein
VVELSAFNYLEAVAEFVTGERALIHAFLRDCVLAGWRPG